MALTTELVALADYVSVSREGKLTIAGIFDRFFVEKVPAQWLKATFVAVLLGEEDSQHKVDFIVTAPSKKKLVNKKMEVRLNSNGKANFITNLRNFPLTEFGEHTISIKKGKTVVCKTRYFVNKRKAPEENGLVN